MMSQNDLGAKRDSFRTLDDIVDGRDFANLDCRSSSCHFIIKRTGMRTNGPCQCLKEDAQNAPFAIERLLAQLVAEALLQRDEARAELAKLKEQIQTANKHLHSCLEWANGGERSYQEIIDYLNQVERSYE